MRGPYRLSPDSVNIRIPDRIGGVYALGKDPKTVTVVGRADARLRDAIKDNWKLHEFFWYDTTLSVSSGYRTLCREYHRHLEQGSLEDKTHPVPYDSDIVCPICGHKG
jgi:hypothetical protein